MFESEQSKNQVVLTSPSGEFRIALELFDSGHLQLRRSTREADGTYMQQPAAKTLAWATEEPTTKNVWVFR
jgi:hypothetical protein